MVRLLACAATLVIGIFLLEPRQALANSPDYKRMADEVIGDLALAEVTVQIATPKDAEEKRTEDLLDLAIRNQDDQAWNSNYPTTNKPDPDKTAAESAVRGAEALTSDTASARAYRKALRERREARNKLRVLLAEIVHSGYRPNYQNYRELLRRGWKPDPSDIEQVIELLRQQKADLEARLSQPGPPAQTGAANQISDATPMMRNVAKSFGPVKVKASLDSQTLCRFGKALPELVLLTPTDGSGKPLVFNIGDTPTAPAGSATTPDATSAPKDGPTPDDEKRRLAAALAVLDMAGIFDFTDDYGPRYVLDSIPEPEGGSILEDVENAGIPGYPTGTLTTDQVVERMLERWLQARRTGTGGLTLHEELVKRYGSTPPQGGPRTSTTEPERPATGEAPGGKPIWIGPITPGTLPGLPKAGVKSSGDYSETPPPAQTQSQPAPQGAPQGNTPPQSPETGSEIEKAAKILMGEPPAGTPPAPAGKPDTKPAQEGASTPKDQPAQSGTPTTTPAPQEASAPNDELGKWLRDRADLQRFLETGQGKLKLDALTPFERYILYLRLLKRAQVDPPPKEETILDEIDEVTVISSRTPSTPDSNILSTAAITIDFKATDYKATPQAVEAGSEGKEQGGALAKLPMRDPAVPGKDKSTKMALDQGFDKRPVTCVLGKDKECRAQVDADDAVTFGLPVNGPRHYRADVVPSNFTGGVIERSAGALKVKPPAVPPGVTVQETDFKIGSQNFTQVDFTGPDAQVALAMAAYGQAYGPQFQINSCREKKPGRPFGTASILSSPVASELPHARLSRMTARSIP